MDTTLTEYKEGKVSVVAFDKKVLVGQEKEPVRVTEKLSPVEIFTDSQGNQLVDFGQNLTGVVELHIKGEKGQKNLALKQCCSKKALSFFVKKGCLDVLSFELRG